MIFVYILGGLAGAFIITAAARKAARQNRKNAIKKLNACWSIGYLSLKHPFKLDLSENIPTYNKFHFTEPVKTLADPFLILADDGTPYMFYEIVFQGASNGKIAVSVFDPENNQWRYKGVIIDEPFHLSYPYVFYAEGTYYMVPETKAAKSVRLYAATEFPLKWEFVKTIIKDRKLVDPCIVYFKGKYYLFANRKKRLYLYCADDLTGNWAPHPKSPVRRGNYSRCAGRILCFNGEMFRPAQELSKGYGNSMRIFKIRELSEQKYSETPLGKGDFLYPFGGTWARFGMHHFDAVKISEKNYFAVFDGKGVPVAPQE
ncbi:MAG: glucosamine inositolphosphorylceramide transferase family protein [Desulfosalsimonas sp.]